MAPRSEGHEQNGSVSSPSLATYSIGTLTSSSLYAPELPFNLVTEILYRLPVKSLLQCRSVCKSWKTLIDEPEFTARHFSISTNRNHHLIASSRHFSYSHDALMWDFSISSIYGAMSTAGISWRKLKCPNFLNNVEFNDVCSCHGILCFYAGGCVSLLWNPSIGKFKVLPCLEKPPRSLSFGYDHISKCYKVVAICHGYNGIQSHVMVHTLGSDCWRRIERFPFGTPIGDGKFLNGTINWFAWKSGSKFNFSSCGLIVSLDLAKESYRKILQPDYGEAVETSMSLGVLRDCLCVCAYLDSSFDIWLMMEYGNSESWTRFMRVPCLGDFWDFIYSIVVVDISEDDQVLMVATRMCRKDVDLVVYNARKGSFKIHEIQTHTGSMVRGVHAESLISPRF